MSLFICHAARVYKLHRSGSPGLMRWVLSPSSSSFSAAELTMALAALCTRATAEKLCPLGAVAYLLLISSSLPLQLLKAFVIKFGPHWLFLTRIWSSRAILLDECGMRGVVS